MLNHEPSPGEQMCRTALRSMINKAAEDTETRIVASGIELGDKTDTELEQLSDAVGLEQRRRWLASTPTRQRYNENT